MAKVQRYVSLLLVAAVAFSMTVFLTSCEKKSDATSPSVAITDDIFPVVAGRKIFFTGFLRSPGADTNITATGSFYQSRWTIGTYNGATAPAVVSSGGTCTAIGDSVRVSPVPAAVGSSPSGTWAQGSLLIQKAVAVGAADFSFMTSLASFYRSVGLASRIDSLRWIKLTDLASGIGVEFTGYDSTYNVTISGAATTARLQIVGKFDGTETLTLAGSTFSTYKLTITRRVYLGGSSTAASIGQTAQLWVAPNIGPVKMILGSDDRNYGHYREFLSKNF